MRIEPTDEELMIRFQSGDRSSLGPLVRRHKRSLYNFALRQLGSSPAAEEAVQDAFVRVVQNAADFKHAARFSTWLYTIVRNLCVDQMRKSSRHQHDASLDQPDQAPEGDAVSVEIRERVLTAVGALPVEQREVFLLREVGNLPFKDIAEVVGVPENTVKSRMRCALERLQSALSEFEEYVRALR